MVTFKKVNKQKLCDDLMVENLKQAKRIVALEEMVAPAQRATNTGSLTIAAQAVIDSYNNGDYSSDFTETILGLRNALQQQ